jgi:hypothetical protein
MSHAQVVELAALFFVIAVLFSSVGHAGASGYLAAMALVGVAPESMRPIALTLNIAVAAFTTWRFRAARYFDAKVIGAFTAGSVPLAFIGGGIALPSAIYRQLVGLVLLASAAYFAWRATVHPDRLVDSSEKALKVPLLAAPLIGAAIGLLSGLTGVGGGILLSPIILLMAWAGPKATAGIAAPFIMANSIAGLAGGLWKGSVALSMLPGAALPLAAVALGGAALGTWLGIHKLSNRWLLAALALVMLISASKLLGLSP